MAKTYRKRNETSSDYFQRQTQLNLFNLAKVLKEGKSALDELKESLGQKLVECLLLMNREIIGGPAYLPKEGFKKWSSQNGSVYVGSGKMTVKVPRLRNSEGEVALPLYERLKNPGEFSDELLDACLAGLSGRKYEEVIERTGKKFGISKSSVSRKVKNASIKQLRQIQERRLENIEPFAIFIDGIHKSGKVVMAAVGVDNKGQKYVLGLWEGATENSEICEAMLCDLENRGLSLHPNILFVTDGGKGISKCLRTRYGKHLLHQRCTIHKKRNILGHLPKRFHVEFKRRFDMAITMASYTDAKKELQSLKKWLEKINSGAANSLEESGELLLTVHRLEFPEELKKSFLTTNIIESCFNGLSYVGKNIKRYRKGDMLLRWMSSVLLTREQKFRKVRGYKEIQKVTEYLAKNTFTLEEEKLAA